MVKKNHIFLELNKGFKPSEKAEHSTMFYSYGWMKSKGIGHTYIHKYIVE
jgi:hypothetical protein